MEETAPARPAGGEAAGDRRWLVAFWAVVVAFAVVAVLGSVRAGVPIRDPGGVWFTRRILVSIVLFALLALVDAYRRTDAGDRSVRRTVEVLRARWPRRRLLVAGTGLTGYWVVYASYRNLKSWVAFEEPQDAMLLRWDRWLFLGHSPAGLLHDLLGVQLSAYVLIAIYQSFTTLVRLAVVAAVVFPTRVKDGYVFLASAVWVWILGVGSYYLIPSLGPFTSDPGQFADLPRTIVTETQARFLAERAAFLADPGAAGALNQVSAFASLHVAVTCMMLLTARYYGLRWTSRFMTVFLIGTVLATVYVGWHFVVDDVAGLVIAVVSVALGRWMVDGVRPGRGRASPSS